MRLRGKVAVVTGTSPNIGGGIAETFAAESAKLVCVDLDPANARDCAAAITKSGGAAMATPCEVTVESRFHGQNPRAHPLRRSRPCCACWRR